MNEIEETTPKPREMMTKRPVPDRVSIKPGDPFFDKDYQNMTVLFEGAKRVNDVHEFCMSEGWIKKIIYMTNGKPIMERGKIRTITMRGKVEVLWTVA